MDEQDSGRRQSSRHKRIRAERVEGSKIWNKNTQRIRNELADVQKLKHGKLREFVMSSLMDEKLEQENMKELMAKSLMNQVEPR